MHVTKNSTQQQSLRNNKSDHQSADVAFQTDHIGQPETVLQLQRIIGNVATQNLIKKQTSNRLQRSPKGIVTEDESQIQVMTADEHHQALKSIANILIRFERMTIEEQRSEILAEIDSNPPQYRNILMHWYRVSVGRLELEPGITWFPPDTGLATEIDQAVAMTRPLIQIIEAHGTPEGRAWVENTYLPQVAHFRAKVISQAVNNRITDRAENEGRLLNPELKAQEQQISESLLPAITTLNDVMGAINAKGTEVVKPIFDDLYANGTPDNVATLFQGKKGWIVLGEAGLWLAAIKDIWELSDPKARAKMFNEKLGWMGTVIGVTDLIGKALNIVQGIASITCIGFASIAKLVGDSSALAAGLLGSRVVAEKLGSAVGWLTVVKGSLATLFAENMSDRLSGMTDIAMGAGALMGFAGSVGGVGALLGHKFITVPTIEKGHNVAKVGFNLGFGGALEKLKVRGDAITHRYNRLNAAIELMVEAEHPEAREAYQNEIDEEKVNLRNQIEVLFNLTEDETPGGVGYYNVLNRRLFEIAPVVDANAPAGDVMRQATAVLDVIVGILSNQDAIRKQAYDENPDPTWMQTGGFE